MPGARAATHENGYNESFNGKLRDELLNGEIFYSLAQAAVLVEQWRREYNTVRPHSACGGFPPAPEAIKPSPWFLTMPVLHGPPQVLGWYRSWGQVSMLNGLSSLRNDVSFVAAHRLARCLRERAELGFRHDAGDGERGGGLELGGGLRYRNSDTGLSVESEGRWLAFHQSTIHEWGFGTRILYDPGASERGVSVGLTPTWGRTASGVAQLWEQGSAVPTSYDATGPRLEAHVGYGFGVPRRRGALTPYVSMALGDEVARGYRVGSHLATGRSTNVNLELERRGHGAAPATYGITARGTILF